MAFAHTAISPKDQKALIQSRDVLLCHLKDAYKAGRSSKDPKKEGP